MSLAVSRERRGSATPPTIYKKIRLDIERRILSGDWPPGHRIPFEHELTTLYGAYRKGLESPLPALPVAGKGGNLPSLSSKVSRFVSSKRVHVAVVQAFSSVTISAGSQR